ncbi:MAG: permease-like cell division protein FtsX, partial [Clostridiales bacterium]|nr:permease-like cell division protein FtsX [Clostridiales bacterium]
PRSLGYQIRQGFRNIGRNRMFSIASIATMTACIFIFGAFFSIIMNVDSLRAGLEQKVGITVFFKEGTADDRIRGIGEEIRKIPHVTSVKYTSADEAWSAYQKEYFSSDPSLAEGFKGDNPLAGYASYTVLVDEVENQDAVVQSVKAIDGVRKVNQSSGAAKNLKSFNRLFTYACVAIITVLLIVSVILIANTVNTGIEVRRNEIAISKLIGATDSFVRAPFIVEGFLLGLIGSVLPLVILYIVYNALLVQILTRFGFLTTMGNVLLTGAYVFQYLVPIALLLGVGVGLIGAVITVRRHLNV